MGLQDLPSYVQRVNTSSLTPAGYGQAGAMHRPFYLQEVCSPRREGSCCLFVGCPQASGEQLITSDVEQAVLKLAPLNVTILATYMPENRFRNHAKT